MRGYEGEGEKESDKGKAHTNDSKDEGSVVRAKLIRELTLIARGLSLTHIGYQ